MDEIEITEEAKVLLEEKHVELVKIIKAFESLEKSEEWATLKEMIFDKALTGIKKQILNESLSPTMNVNKLYQLQGEYMWAKRYCDVNKFTEVLKKQLEDINKKIK